MPSCLWHRISKPIPPKFPRVSFVWRTVIEVPESRIWDLVRWGSIESRGRAVAAGNFRRHDRRRIESSALRWARTALLSVVVVVMVVVVEAVGDARVGGSTLVCHLANRGGWKTGEVSPKAVGNRCRVEQLYRMRRREIGRDSKSSACAVWRRRQPMCMCLWPPTGLVAHQCHHGGFSLSQFGPFGAIVGTPTNPLNSHSLVPETPRPHSCSDPPH